jgi:TolA-binding protein
MSSRFLNAFSLLLLLLAVTKSVTAQDVVEVEPPPLTASELYEKGIAAFDAGKWQEAEESFTQLQEDYGTNAEVQAALVEIKPLLALAKVRGKNFSDAIPLIEECLLMDTVKDELKSELKFWLGLCFMQTQRHIEAQITFGEFYKHHYPQRPHITRCHESLILFGVAYTIQGQHSDAADFFAWQMPKLRRESPEAAARVTVLLLYSLLEGERYDEALTFVREQFEDIEQVTQLISFQSLALELGSQFLEHEEYHKAIACLQRVWLRERLITHQEARLAELEQRLAILKERDGMQDFVFQYDGMVRRTRLELENFKGIDNFDSALRLRLATAFMGLERYREAALIMENMLLTMEPDPVVESAAISLIQCWMQIENWPKAVQAADMYLSIFDNNDQNDRVPLVLLLKGNSLKDDLKRDEAYAVFGDIVTRFPTGDYAPRALFMQGIVKLNLDENGAGIALFKETQKRYPKHPITEDAAYWEGMAYSFDKQHETARAQFATYLKAHPKGRYVGDATFRRAFCLQAMADYENAAKDLQVFLTKHEQTSSYTNEARLLLGDALLAIGEIDKGITTYKKIDPTETKFFEEAWFKIGKAYRLMEQPAEMRAHFEEFVTKYPASNRTAEAVYWVGWTHRAEEHPEKARDIYWETLRENGDNPDLYGMADILDALPKVYSGDKDQLRLDLQKLASDATAAKQDTLALRANWALAANSKGNQVTIAMNRASELCDFKIHNPRITADCADFLRETGTPILAAKLYTGLRKWHPRALEKERVYYGLGRIAMDAGNKEEALTQFEKFEKYSLGGNLLGEVMLNKATLLSQLDRGNEAAQVLEDLLGSKLTNSKHKAQALYNYGQMLAADGDDITAIAYFERLYLAYGKYRELVAKAYYARGQALERLVKKQEAQEVYAELLGREELGEFEVIQEARLRLDALKGDTQ